MLIQLFKKKGRMQCNHAQLNRQFTISVAFNSSLFVHFIHFLHLLKENEKALDKTFITHDPII